MRKHYMTLCARGNIEVTHIRDDSGAITVTFEQAVQGGFNTLETTLDGQVLSNEGFTPSDVAYFLTFLRNNKSAIYAESIGEL
jgi:hypothetical protein